MGNLPLPVSSGAGVLNFSVAPPRSEPATESFEALPSVALLDVLREAVTSGTLSTDAILNALADTARVLSGADGTAVASRKDGVIVCQARSGEIAPDLGAPVNADSGISGECLRRGTAQICSDTLTDDRVDGEACRGLGIRSVAVLPLRGRTGIFGILEAFSARADAFEMEHIDSLRALAEIAELAYSREERVLTSVPIPPPMVRTQAVRPALTQPAMAQPTMTRSAIVAPVAATPLPQRRRLSPRRYWILGGIAFIVLLLTAAVVRMSWRQTGAEIAESVTQPQATSATEAQPVDYRQPIVSLKPNAAISATAVDGKRNRGGVENAAEVEPLTDAQPLTPGNSSSGISAMHTKETAISTEDAPPPPVQIAVGNPADAAPKLASPAATLPAFGGTVSLGVVPASLIQQVEPSYPVQARALRLTGSVVMDAAISADGAVRNVTVVSGSPILANAATAAVKQWRYNPALLDGKPIETQKRIKIVFNP